MHSFDTDFATECQNCAILTLSCKIVEETSLLLTRWSWREGPGGRGKHASLANYNLAGICSATTTMSDMNTNTNTNTHTSVHNYKLAGICSATTTMSVVNTNTNTNANTNTSADNYKLTGTCSATIMSVVNVLYRLVHTFTKPLNLAGTCNFL